MKYQQMQKRLIVELVASSVFIGLLGGAIYMLSSMLEEVETSKRNNELDLTKTVTERSALVGKYDKTRQFADLYEAALKKNPQRGIYGNRQDIQEQFKVLQREYDINNLTLSISPARDVTEAKFKRPNLAVYTSELKLNFDTLLDNNAIALISGLERELLGVLRITSFKLTRTEDLSDKALRAVTIDGSYPLIRGEIIAVWRGIKTIEPLAKDAPAAKP